jgi:AAA+ ATPase superfamily predicted ATPase
MFIFMQKNLIGRKKEEESLLKALHSAEPEMVAIIGRRRVGKTYLVRSVYAQLIRFEITGLQNATLKSQLINFSIHLKAAFGEAIPNQKPNSWLEAFHQLTECWDKNVDLNQKYVVFLDELPWLASPKSGFLDGLSFFWNSWAVKKNIVVVICGSAASWMIQNVVNNKGGLHNRITRRIQLFPFNLYETDAFLRSKHILLDQYQIIQLYMAIGGIPHYLKEVEAGKSAAQNIEQICFSTTGLLNDEFMRLYPALFEDATHHISIIRAMAQKWKGLTRQEIIAATNLPDGGNLTRYLDELVHSGFITLYPAFGKKQKDLLYRLTDEYSLFYLHFLQKNKHPKKNTWQQLSQTQEFKSWCGYAFENLCLKHVEQIKKALGISGIYSETGCFYHKGTATQQGVQIDLLIDRKDNVINLFEVKFYSEPFSINKSYAAELREKVNAFKSLTATRKQIFLNLLSTYGLKSNEHSLGLINADLPMDVLFEKD